MIKKSLWLISFFVLSSLSFSLLFPPIVFAQDQFGLKEAAQKGGLIKEGETPSIARLTGRIIGGILALVGVIFLIIIIYGGITWMTAGGNEEKIKKAKGMIVNSVIGLIIILAAYSFVSFIFTQISGATK